MELVWFYWLIKLLKLSEKSKVNHSFCVHFMANMCHFFESLSEKPSCGNVSCH